MIWTVPQKSCIGHKAELVEPKKKKKRKRNFLLILKENAEKAKATIENGLSTYIESDDVPPNARKRPTQSSKKSHQSFVSLFWNARWSTFDQKVGGRKTVRI